MTVRFEDWTRELVTLSNASFATLDPHEVISEEGTVVSGATRHKLESAKVVGPAEVEGTASRLSGALSWAAWQAIRWIPDRDVATKTFWGVILKQASRYGPRYSENKIDLGVIRDPGHAFFHSRPVSLDGDAVAGAGVRADDYMKDLVAACFTGATPGGTSLEWDFGGVLAIEADTSEAAVLTNLGEFNGWLDQVLDAIGEQYDVDWELLPSVSGTTITWTFNTKSPRGGTDRTSGAGRTVIDDFAGSAPAGERYQDRTELVNEWVQKGGGASTKDATSQTAWGVWVGITEQDNEDGRKVDLALSAVQDGSEWSYEDALTGAEWMTDFNAGDLVVKANSRTNEAEANGKIEAVSWSWSSGILRTEIRWGDKKPTYTSKKRDSAHGGGSKGSKAADSTTEVYGHNILSAQHEDTAASVVVEGSLIIGNATPAWSQLAIGIDGTWLKSNGTTAAWAALQAADIPDISATYVPVTRTVAAGNGLTGGGALSANITITMGAPGTLTAATANGVTAESHTHGITTTTAGAASTIVSTDANSYITATRFHLGATVFINAWDTRMEIQAGSDTRILRGGALRFRVTDTAVEAWSTDLAISTTAKGITHVDGNTDGAILVGNGVRYVPGTIADITAPGLNTQVIVNQDGVLAGNAGLTFDDATGVLTIG